MTLLLRIRWNSSSTDLGIHDSAAVWPCISASEAHGFTFVNDHALNITTELKCDELPFIFSRKLELKFAYMSLNFLYVCICKSRARVDFRAVANGHGSGERSLIEERALHEHRMRTRTGRYLGAHGH